jgi:GT2 family glycosyltransferase
MDISIIIPTYNRNNLLYRHLAVAFKELAGLSYEILVINDSKTNVVEIPQEWQSAISVYNNPKQGVASARNYGVSLAKSDNLLFVDDDMIINRKAVQRAIDFLKEKSNDCLNVDWVYPPELRERMNGYQFGRYLEHFGFTTLRGWLGPDFKWKPNETIQVEAAASYFLAMTRESFTRSGAYDENFPFAGFEDHDFATRLERNGVRTFLDTSVMVWHNEEDRVELNGWMQRKFRGGQTRRVAVRMGHKDLELNFDNLKGKIYFLIAKTEFLFTVALKIIPNVKMFDPLYFKIVNILLGTNLYKGYTLAS